MGRTEGTGYETPSLMGIMIGKERAKRRISLNVLAAGLCDKSVLHRIEMGDRGFDRLTLVRLWERLGKTPERFQIIMSDEEYELWERRQKIAEAVDRWEFARARRKLEQYREDAKDKPKIHQQFAGYYELIIREAEGQTPLEELRKDCLKLIRITMPFCDYADWSLYYLGQMELMLQLWNYRCLEEMGQQSEAEEGYRKLLRYIETHDFDKLEKQKVYPQVIYRLARLLKLTKQYPEAEALAQRASELLLRTKGGVRLLPELLILQMECQKEQGILDNYTVQLGVWGGGLAKCLDERETYRRYQDEHPRYRDCDAYSFTQVMRSRRKCLGLTQQAMAETEEDPEARYSPNTISKNENGRHMPQKKRRRKILEKLGLDGECYSGYFICDSMDAAVRFDEVNDALERGDLKRAKEQLSTLKELLSAEKRMNRQVIAFLELLIAGREGGITGEIKIEKLKKIFRYTLDIEDFGRLERCFLSATERLIIQTIANEYKKLKRYEEAYEMVRILTAQERIDVKYIQSMWAAGDYLGDLGRYQEGNQIIEKAIQISVQERDCWCMDHLLYTEAWNLETEGKVSGKLPVMRRFMMAYIFADMFDRAQVKRQVLKHCKELYPHMVQRIERDFNWSDEQ